MNQLDPATVRYIGAGLHRPECVLATHSGHLFTCDWTLGIAQIAPDQTITSAVHPSVIEQGLLPNGFALAQDKSFLFANLSEAGGVWRATSGGVEPFLMEADGRKIPPANFVFIDAKGRIWITISALTRSHQHFSKFAQEGFIVLLDKGTARIVADSLTWTNELRLSPDGKYLYVNETFASRTTRFTVAENGDLSDRHLIDMPLGTFPDGMAIDETGAIWTICVVSGRLVRIDPSGAFEIVMDDFDQTKHAEISAAYPTGEITREMIIGNKGKFLDNPTSIAFGGEDRKTLYLGSISAKRLAVIDMPVAGLKPAHWDWI